MAYTANVYDVYPKIPNPPREWSLKREDDTAGRVPSWTSPEQHLYVQWTGDRTGGSRIVSISL